MLSKINFFGSHDAELFTLEIAHSARDAIKHLLDMDEKSPSYGFMQASFDGRPWTDTMWTRDAGVMLRELACYGALDEAKALAACLVRMVTHNAEGFFTFPEHLDRFKPGSGEELDGTASIVIGMVYLMRRISKDDTVYRLLDEFLTAEDSPINFVKYRLKLSPLIAGTGEFGGGCGIEGRFVNTVQNALVRGMLLVYDQFLRETNRPDESLKEYAEAIRIGMLKYLTDSDGSWIWCVKPDTLKPDLAVLNHEINKGIAHINDVTALLSDVEGLDVRDKELLSRGRSTFDRDMSFPRRKFLFDTYGMWLQFDEYNKSSLSSPSYACGYAIQAMALTDRIDWLGKCVKFLAEYTYNNVTPVTREDKYWFFERMFAPDRLSEIDSWEGCGALNLVNVAEPMKAARLIAGIDCAGNGTLALAPRLPWEWDGVEIKDWLIPGKGRVNGKYTRVQAGKTPVFGAVDSTGAGYEFESDVKFDSVRFGPFKCGEIDLFGGCAQKLEQTDEGLCYITARPE